MPRRKVATTIDTATAEEDVKDFDGPEKNLTGFDQVLLLNTLCKQVRDEAQAQSQSLTSSSAVAASMVVAAFLLGLSSNWEKQVTSFVCALHTSLQDRRG